MDSYGRSKEVEKVKPDTLPLDPDVKAALKLIGQEVMAARCTHPVFQSAHEGYAVLLEEIEELWEEVRKKRGTRTRERMQEECVQIAAMAIRFLTDVQR